jgi:hypothetical protein
VVQAAPPSSALDFKEEIISLKNKKRGTPKTKKKRGKPQNQKKRGGNLSLPLFFIYYYTFLFLLFYFYFFYFFEI